MNTVAASFNTTVRQTTEMSQRKKNRAPRSSAAKQWLKNWLKRRRSC